MDVVDIDSGGVRLSLTVAGDQDGPPLLLLHGWPQSSLCFSKLAPLLAEHRLLIPDQRGFGNSERPEGTASYSMGLLVADALAILDWAGVQRAGVVGHDLGGSVAWALGALAPDRVRAMVIMASPHPMHFKRVSGNNPQQMQRAFYVWLLNSGPAGERLLARNGFQDLAQWAFGESSVTAEERAAYIEQWSQPGAFTAMAEWYRANYTPDLVNTEVPLELAPVTVPVRYVAAERDPAFAAGMDTGSGDYVDAAYDEHVMAGTSHWMLSDDPAGAAHLVADWMERHP